MALRNRSKNRYRLIRNEGGISEGNAKGMVISKASQSYFLKKVLLKVCSVNQGFDHELGFFDFAVEVQTLYYADFMNSPTTEPTSC
jgi:hypothetical protein